jgi:hypothetical protein
VPDDADKALELAELYNWDMEKVGAESTLFSF